MPTVTDERIGQQDHDVSQPVGQEVEDPVQHLLVERRKDILEVLDDRGAEYWPEQRTHAAQDGHQHDLARRRPLHAFRTCQRIDQRHQRTGQTGIHA